MRLRLGALLWLLGLAACSSDGMRGEVGIFDRDAGDGAHNGSASGGSHGGANDSGSDGSDPGSTAGAPLHVEIVATQTEALCKGECIELTANVSPGTPPFTYHWNQGLPDTQGPHTVCPDASTVYSVTASDADRGTNEFGSQPREASASLVVEVAAACGDSGMPIDPPPSSGGMELCRASFNGGSLGIGDSSPDTFARPLSVDADGNAIIVGALARLGGGLELGSDPIVSGGADTEPVVAKFDSNCELSWVRHFVADPEPLYPLSPTTSALILQSTATAGASDIYLAGSLRGVAQIGATTVGAPLEWGVVLVRMTAAGDIAWAHSFTVLLDLTTRRTDVAADTDGNAILAASVPGGTDLGGGAMTGNADEFVSAVAKYDRDGQHRWSHVVRGASRGLDVEVGANGAVFVLGRASAANPIEIEGSGLAAPDFENQWFLIELDSDGAFRAGSWIDPSGIGLHAQCGGLAVDADNSARALFQTWKSDTYVESGPNATVGVVKYSADREEDWQRALLTASNPIGPVGNDAVDVDGNVAISTRFSGDFEPLDPPPDAGEINPLFVAVYDAAGTMLWSKAIEGTDRDINGLAFDSTGNLFMSVSALADGTETRQHTLIKLAP